jgi:hypothetical protein
VRDRQTDIPDPRIQDTRSQTSEFGASRGC